MERKPSLLYTPLFRAAGVSRRPAPLALARQRRRRHGRVVGWMLVEEDAQAQLDLPALDPHVFQDQTQQLLAALEVQPVQARQRPRGEGLDALAEAVRS